MSQILVIPKGLERLYSAKVGRQTIGIYRTEQEAINACWEWLQHTSLRGWICKVSIVYRDTRDV